jgi:copper homeostasis protein
LEGAKLIKQLLERAEGRIEVLPGAGITVDNVRHLVDRTGCTQVHLTAFAERQDPSTLSNAGIYFGAPNGPEESKYELTDREYVRRMKAELPSSGKADPSRAEARS